MFQSILIANRGEVAVRIIRACRGLGVRSVALYSDADAKALHVRLADASYRLGKAPAGESYLNIEKIIDVAKKAGVEAVHPGYGLLSENSEFASAVIEAGLVFIGPTPEVIATMGDKVAARDVAKSTGMPLLPASDGVISDPEKAVQAAERIGFPVVVKACFGGGGRGMRVAEQTDAVKHAIEAAARESNAAFGRAEVYLEHYVSHARHVEVQVLGDGHGNVIHIGTRDCSVQRRHQKLIEEAPAPDLPDELRAKITAAAVRLAQSVNYGGAGTVEFLVDRGADKFYFLEMNTRLQVEHGVTELVSGIDLVQCQIQIAVNGRLELKQEDVHLSGHAMQARIAAEDPWEDFRPSPGTVDSLYLPLGPWVRIDFGVEAGDSVPGYYDSMFGKVQAWGRTRDSARRRLADALQALQVGGLPTTAPYQFQVLNEPEFMTVTHDTGSVERSWQPDPGSHPILVDPIEKLEVSRALDGLSKNHVCLSTLGGDVEVAIYSRRGVVRATRSNNRERTKTVTGKVREPVAPMDGAVVAVSVKIGQDVEKGVELVVLEAMKMEVPVLAPRSARVEEVLVSPGEMTSRGSLLVRLSESNHD